MQIKIALESAGEVGPSGVAQGVGGRLAVPGFPILYAEQRVGQALPLRQTIGAPDSLEGSGESAEEEFGAEPNNSSRPAPHF